MLESDYDGVQFDVQKRMSNRWQMLAGLTPPAATAASITAAPTRDRTCDRAFNNPNCLINRYDGSVFTDLPWVFTLSGSYLLPCGTSRSPASTPRATATR